jgi:hypothetical protein
MVNKAFIEYKIDTDVVIRTFNDIIDEKELQWHWDEEDRIVESLNENDWQLQFDNELPILFDKKILIPKGVYHRVIKGSVPLIVKITKL